jgi:hypothetical protein
MVSLITLLVLAAVLVVGYQCRSFFGYLRDHHRYRSAMQRGAPSSTLERPLPTCPRCKGDLETGQVTMRYWSDMQDISLVLQGFDPFHLSMGRAEAMLTGSSLAPMRGPHRAYRCPTCGIIGVDMTSRDAR